MATIYVGPSETYTTIADGIAAMSSGDTLIVRDGTYTGADNRIRGVPSGSESGGVRTFTTIRAETDFGVILSGITCGTGLANEESVIALYNKEYVKIQGFLIKDAVGSTYALSCAIISHSQYCEFKNIGVKMTSDYCSDSNYYGGPFEFSYSDHCLMEDCFACGNIRYGILFYGGPDSHHNIARRCVIRWDFASTTQPRASIANYGGYKSGYGTPEGASVDNLVQNCIVIDGNDGSGVSPSTFTGGFSAPAVNDGLLRRGCICLNNAGYGFHTSEHSDATYPGRDNRNRNCVGWENTADNSAWWRELAEEETYESGMFDSTLKDGVLRGSTDGYTHADRNLIINGSTADIIEGTGSDANSSYATASAAGLQYIVRSSVSGKGATIEYKRGVDETFYGDTGYDDLTSNKLWPFPNEDTIKSLFSESNTPHSGASPTTNTVTRGFCSTGKQLNGSDDVTLTSYIWEYIGTQIPSDIYGGSSAITISNQNINLPGLELSSKADIAKEAQMLNLGKTYYWRIKYKDSAGKESPWSQAGSFTLSASSISSQDIELPALIAHGTNVESELRNSRIPLNINLGL